MRSATATPPQVAHGTVVEALWATVDAHPERPAFLSGDGRLELTWGDIGREVERLGRGLLRAGVGHGDTVALMLGNRPEFNVVDLAVAAIGAVPFSVYNTASGEQIAYVVADSGARLAIVEAQFADHFRAAAHGTGVERILVLEDGALEALADDDPAVDVRARSAELRPDDLVTVVYTSGTTGPPKGVQVTHANVLATLNSTLAVMGTREHPRFISWLPAAHMAERMANHYSAAVLGATVTCCPDARQVLPHLAAHRPTWFFAVPRLWEKLKAGLEAAWEGLPAAERQRIDDDLAARLAVVRAGQADGVPTAEQERAALAADARSFAPLRAQVGLDDVDAICVASAPCPREVVEFFHALGLPLNEIWGMTETTACGTFNPPDRIRIGTVGLPLPGTEIRLEDDGEILVRGASVTRGYLHAPQATQAAIDREGWLRTGDIGAFDEAGYLRIVDRKKELIINAGGKNMSPANIEAAIKVACPLVAHAVAVGDGRPYNVALLVLDPDFAPAWASVRGLEPDLQALAAHPDVVTAVRAGVQVANDRLSRIEQIKRFILLAGPWPTEEGQELTPTQKLRRSNIAAHHRADIDDLYAARAGVEVNA